MTGGQKLYTILVFINMGDIQRGYNYYNDIISNIPSSIYAGIAKGEMEEDEWRKNLNK